MKKIIILFLGILLLFESVASAEGVPKFSELTDEEIIQQIQDACRELAIRSAEERKNIYRDDGRSILITLDKIALFTSTDLVFSGTIINGSEEEIRFGVKEFYINNWECPSHGYHLTAEAKRNNKGGFSWTSLQDANISTLDEIKIIEGNYLIRIGDEEIVLPFVYTDFSW